MASGKGTFFSHNGILMSFKKSTCVSLVLLLQPLSTMASDVASQYAEVTDPKLRRLATQTFENLTSEAGTRTATGRALGASSGAAGTESVIQVSSKSRDGQWMLGSVTETLPEDESGAPRSRHFLAKLINGEWSIAMLGDDRFESMLRSAPDEIVGADLRRALVEQVVADRSEGELRPIRPRGAVSDSDTGLGLPWAPGAAWFSAGVHGNSGGSRPYNSIDFDGGDGRVLAPADGVFQMTCKRGRSALVHLTHDNGLKTTYYHMTNIADISEGQKIKAGTYLGTIGNELPCGGMSSGAHVHFSLLQGTNEISVNNKKLGGWTFFEGRNPYGGYAVRAGRRVDLPGGTMINDGPSAAAVADNRTVPSGTVTWGTGANIRTSPSLSAATIRTAPKGENLSLQCYKEGDYFDGLWGKTNLWYQLVEGGWVNDGTIYTGKNTAITPRCQAGRGR